MSRKSKAEYIGEKRRAYACASAAKRRQILDEVCETLCYTRKYVIKLMTGNIRYRERKGRGRTYSDHALANARRVWEAVGCPCTTYFVAELPRIVREYEECIALIKPREDVAAMLAMSASTLDRAFKGLPRVKPFAVKANKRSGLNRPILDAVECPPTYRTDPERIVLVDCEYCGLAIDARWKLIETTKQKHRESGVFASDEEKQNLENEWAAYFGSILEKSHAKSERNAERCIRHAAGRARFIVEQEDDVSFSDLLEGGRSLLKDLLDLIRGKGEDEPELKKDLSHTAELLRNITIMIYELGGCCGYAATGDDVTAILTGCKASDLPEDAAAITYAVGMAAKAYFESGKTLPRKDLKAVFANAKEEGLQLDFDPMCEDDPATSFLFDDDEDDEDEFDDADVDDDEVDDDDDDDGGDDPRLIGSLCKTVNLNGAGLSGSFGGGEDDADADAVDYGDGFIASASGGAPEHPDNVSGKPLRLPGDYPAPAKALKTDAVSGGWGYTMRDAAVVPGGIPAEHDFIRVRVGRELRRIEEMTGEKFVFPDYEKYAHELVCEGHDFYDHLYVQVELIPQADWDRLKADWESHDGYENDRKGRRNHEKWRESRTIRFTEHFWFNVNAMFDFGFINAAARRSRILIP